VPASCSHHRFVALTANKIKLFRLSGDDCGTSVNVSPEPEVEVITGNSINDFHPGQFVAVIYDNDWYIGFMIERSDEHQDILVKFMSKSCKNILTWPRRVDTVHVGCQSPMCFAFFHHQ